MALSALVQRRRATPTRAHGRRCSSASACSAPSLFYGDSDDHAGDLGAVGGRGPEGRRAQRSAHLVLPISLGDPRRRCSLSSASAPAPVGSLFGPVMVRLVRRARGRRAAADRAAPVRSSRRSRRRYGARFVAAHPVHRVRRDGRGRARHHRRRGAVRRHGPLRRARRSAAPGSSLVFPALTLNYLGQGALILRHAAPPSATRSSCSCPPGRGCPMVVLATLATVIASQAVISGAFSVSPPGGAARLPAAADHPPHLRAARRPDLRAGVNWLLFVAVLVAHARLPLLRRLGDRLRRRRHRHASSSTRSCSSSSRARCWHWPRWKLVARRASSSAASSSPSSPPT